MSALPRFIKRSATGLLLPADATEWAGVYVPAIELTVARRPLPRSDYDFAGANKACAEFELCGELATRSVSMREFVGHIVDLERYGPCLDPQFFTIEDPWQWIWTSDECAPRGYAVAVDLCLGDVYRYHRSVLYSALACRPGQVDCSSVLEAA